MLKIFKNRNKKEIANIVENKTEIAKIVENKREIVKIVEIIKMMFLDIKKSIDHSKIVGCTREPQFFIQKGIIRVF